MKLTGLEVNALLQVYSYVGYVSYSWDISCLHTFNEDSPFSRISASSNVPSYIHVESSGRGFSADTKGGKTCRVHPMEEEWRRSSPAHTVDG